MEKRDTIRREPIPIAQSVSWLPVGDSRHVVASLSAGGNRQLFVSQDVLARLNSIGVVSRSRPMLGLLIGALYQCPTTKADYVVVESLAGRAWSLPRPGHGLGALKEAASAQGERASHRIVGWYFAEEAPGPLSAEAEAAHTALFDRPWQVALALGSRPDGSWGSFFRHDPSGAGWYRAPFRELIPSQVPENHAKPTAIDWPTYLTGDETVLIPATKPLPDVKEARAPTTGPAEANAVATLPSRVRRGFGSILRGVTAPASASEPGLAPTAPVSAAKAAEIHRPVPAADRPIPLRPVPRADGRPAHATPHLTRPSDAPADDAIPFIEAARQDGFFPVATFATAEPGPRSEVLWVLHDPYCGLLVLATTRGAEVLDASLHYNQRIEDPATLASTFSEHRNLATRVVYRRESCADDLPARCRQLRDMETLVRDWTVTPPIYLVTLGEWEALAGADPIGGSRDIQSLNRRRVAALPESIVLRYGLAAR